MILYSLIIKGPERAALEAADTNIPLPYNVFSAEPLGNATKLLVGPNFELDAQDLHTALVVWMTKHYGIVNPIFTDGTLLFYSPIQAQERGGYRAWNAPMLAERLHHPDDPSWDRDTRFIECGA